MIDNYDCSNVLTTLLNTYPELDGEEIRFAQVEDKRGIAVYPAASAAVLREKTDVCGWVYQSCAYAFNVIYRAVPQSEEQRLSIKSFLDKLAGWLEQLPASSCPPIGDGRKITNFAQQSAACLSRRYDDGVEDWAVLLQMRYTNTFKR